VPGGPRDRERGGAHRGEPRRRGVGGGSCLASARGPTDSMSAAR
jgi:hypothetical protein